MKKFYEVPKQVKWFDYNEDKWIGGIAFHDFIICGCCGGVLELNEFEEKEVIEYEDWVDIEIEIRSDDNVEEN